MNTTTASDSPVTVAADNAEQVLADLAAATEGSLYRFALNGTEQDGLYAMTAGVADHLAGNAEPDRIARIVISTSASAPASGNRLRLARVKGSTIRLPMADLDGTRPGLGHAALEVELREGAILLRATEPEHGQFEDYAYALEFAQRGPATISSTRILFRGPHDQLDSLANSLTTDLGLQTEPPAQP